MLRKIEKKNQRQQQSPEGNGQEQLQEEETATFYEAAQEVLHNADLETILDFDTFCSAVLNIAKAPLRQKPSVYLQMGL